MNDRLCAGRLSSGNRTAASFPVRNAIPMEETEQVFFLLEKNERLGIQAFFSRKTGKVWATLAFSSFPALNLTTADAGM